MVPKLYIIPTPQSRNSPGSYPPAENPTSLSLRGALWLLRFLPVLSLSLSRLRRPEFEVGKFNKWTCALLYTPLSRSCSESTRPRYFRPRSPSLYPSLIRFTMYLQPDSGDRHTPRAAHAAANRYYLDDSRQYPLATTTTVTVLHRRGHRRTRGRYDCAQ